MNIELFKELEMDTWISGNFGIFEFSVFDLDDPSVPVDLTLFQEIRWVLFEFGDSENPILNLVAEIVASDNSKFDVFLESSFTKDIDGVFVHQPILIDSAGREFRPAQGVINILTRGKEDNSQYIQP